MSTTRTPIPDPLPTGFRHLKRASRQSPVAAPLRRGCRWIGSGHPVREPEPWFRIRRAVWGEDRATLQGIREQVFILEQGVPRELEWDGGDGHAIHLLAEDTAGRPLGTARLLPSGQIGRMAVLGQWRKRGIGGQLLRRIIEIARQEGFPTPWLNSQSSALGFYLREGFAAEGEAFLEAGIPHRRMSWRPRANPEPGEV